MHEKQSFVEGNSLSHNKVSNESLKFMSGQNSALNLFKYEQMKLGYNHNTRSEKKLDTGIQKEFNDSGSKKKYKGKYARPASPGINGKVAEPSYKKMMKGYLAPRTKLKYKVNQRQQIASAQTVKKSITNSASLKEITPIKCG